MRVFTFLICSMFSTILFSGQSLRDLDSIFLNKQIPVKKKKKYVDQLLSEVKTLDNKGVVDIVFDLPPLCAYQGTNKVCEGTYLPLNPSIIKIDHGYYVTCRVSDYKYPVYSSMIKGAHIRNKQFFLTFDNNFLLHTVQELPPLSGEILNTIHKEIQFEDVRLMRMHNEFWLCATAPLAFKRYSPRYTLTKLHIADTGYVSLDKTLLFLSPVEGRGEKNWMHVFENDTLKFIYSYDPLIVIVPNLETGSCAEVVRHKSLLDYSRFRGSAAPIPLGDGYLMVVHELMKIVPLASQTIERHYTHRFLYLDKDYTIRKISLPFKFEGADVEYCTSMTLDHTENNLVLAVGIRDCKAKLFLYDLEYVKSHLMEVSPAY